MYRYEATIKKLARKLWPELKRKSDMTLSGPLLKAKTEFEWEEWEYENPEHTRAGYKVDPNNLRSKEMLEGQPRWRLEWMRRTEGALRIYRDSPRNLRIDPTFCPCDRRYSWDEFAKIRARFPLALNYPQLPSPEHYTDLTEEWMAKVCHQYLEKYAEVPDFAVKMMCKFLNLLLVCFQDFQEIQLLDPSFHQISSRGPAHGVRFQHRTPATADAWIVCQDQVSAQSLPTNV